MLFYVLLREVVKSKKMIRLTPVFTGLYFVGWPVYNYIQGGFVYWGIASTLAMLGLYLIFRYKENKIEFKYLAGSLIINLMAIAICYMLYTPYIAVLYGFIILQLSWKNIKNKKRFVFICLGIVAVAAVLFLILVMKL